MNRAARAKERSPARRPYLEQTGPRMHPIEQRAILGARRPNSRRHRKWTPLNFHFRQGRRRRQL